MSRWPSKVFVVGNKDSGSARMLVTAFQQSMTDIKIEVVDNSLLFEPRYELNEFTPIFIILEEFPLTIKRPSIYVPNQILNDAWQFLSKEQSVPIYIAAGQEHFFGEQRQISSLDTVSFMLSGLNGVWEISPNLFSNTPEHKIDWDRMYTAWNHKQFFVYGNPAKQLSDFQERIFTSGWIDLPQGTTEAYKKYCFHAAIALSILRDQSFKVVDVANLTTVAQHLKHLSNGNGFALGDTILAKVLGYLERYIKSANVKTWQKENRKSLPSACRRLGFPASLPLIRQKEVHVVMDDLFEGLNSIEFPRNWDAEQCDFQAVLHFTRSMRRGK